ncbi:MAG: hypothetical protein V4564_20110 [Pseudomonadota bacterium]
MISRSWKIILGASLTLVGAGCSEKPKLAVLDGPAPLCALTQAEFNGWKAAGGAAGFAAPNSTTFKSTDDCSFYKWSSQMFLWLTSPDATGTMNMFSPTFYTAVESVETGKFALVRNPGGTVNALKSGKPVTISFRARVNKPVVLRTHTPAQLAAALGNPNNKSNDSTGQAGGGVLVLDGKSVPVPGKAGFATYPVAYYAIQVNDVFAGLQANQANVSYYQSGASAGDFPTTLPQGQQIQTAAGTTYPDVNQLALEVKSSWVDTAYLTTEQAAGLTTIQGQVPAFKEIKDKKGNLALIWDGKTMATRTLAMVGIHVTGTVAGHPEMIWATFETDFNAPDNSYSYINASFDPKTNTCKTGTCLNTIPFATSSSTPSIFYNGQSGASAPPTTVAETATSSDFNTAINSTSPALVATNVVRYNPWGNQQPATPSLTDPVVRNNTMLLSLKQTLSSQLTALGGQSAIYANYFQVGSLWTNGVIPPASGSKQFGSLYLANTTMETFQQVSPQNSDPEATAANCFSCHGNFANVGTGVSHVFPNVATSTANRPAAKPTPATK